MDDLTRLPGTGLEGNSARDVSASGSSHNSDWGRFAPGTIFAGRFRIVAPLGGGGMGEVYRADDLKLGQTVALKLLPDHLARDPARLAQFHNEGASRARSPIATCAAPTTSATPTAGRF